RRGAAKPPRRSDSTDLPDLLDRASGERHLPVLLITRTFSPAAAAAGGEPIAQEIRAQPLTQVWISYGMPWASSQLVSPPRTISEAFAFHAAATPRSPAPRAAWKAGMSGALIVSQYSYSRPGMRCWP